MFSKSATAELTFLPSLIPSLIHRPCVKRGFDCHSSGLRYPLFQTLILASLATALWM
jgi:hypothetical protein